MSQHRYVVLKFKRQFPTQEDGIIGIIAIEVSRSKIFSLYETGKLLGKSMGEHERADVASVLGIV